MITLKETSYGADTGSLRLCSPVLCSVHSCSPRHSACSSCRSEALLSSACCSGPAFPEACREQSQTHAHGCEATVRLQLKGKPARELDELDVVSAAQQRFSVLQQDGSADEELEREVGVEGLRLALARVVCERRDTEARVRVNTPTPASLYSACFTCALSSCQPFLISGLVYLLGDELQVVAAQDLEQTQGIAVFKLPLETQQQPPRHTRKQNVNGDQGHIQ